MPLNVNIYMHTCAHTNSYTSKLIETKHHTPLSCRSIEPSFYDQIFLSRHQLPNFSVRVSKQTEKDGFKDTLKRSVGSKS